jgi:hypothetical protein
MIVITRRSKKNIMEDFSTGQLCSIGLPRASRPRSSSLGGQKRTSWKTSAPDNFVRLVCLGRRVHDRHHSKIKEHHGRFRTLTQRTHRVQATRRFNGLSFPFSESLYNLQTHSTNPPPTKPTTDTMTEKNINLQLEQRMNSFSTVLRPLHNPQGSKLQLWQIVENHLSQLTKPALVRRLIELCLLHDKEHQDWSAEHIPRLKAHLNYIESLAPEKRKKSAEEK